MLAIWHGAGPGSNCRSKAGVLFTQKENDTPRFFGGPLEMLSNFVTSFVKLLLYQAQQQAKLRESAKKDEAAN